MHLTVINISFSYSPGCRLTHLGFVSCLARIHTPKSPLHVSVKIANSVAHVHFQKDPCVHPFQKLDQSTFSMSDTDTEHIYIYIYMYIYIYIHIYILSVSQDAGRCNFIEDWDVQILKINLTGFVQNPTSLQNFSHELPK